MSLASIPSPSQGVWHLGPVPVRAYALCIIAGVVAAIVIGERRWVDRGGRRGTVTDVAAIAVPFGLVGGRLYHVLTTPQPYFGKGGHPIEALYIWRGGLGIWGAIALGGVGAWIACRRHDASFPAFADALAPGIAVAQAIGRWGNYFNQELFGRPTSLPWGLKIDPGRDGTVPGKSTYHPTFLYESLWCLGAAGVVIWADRRFRLGRGRAFALYVALYTVGRAWIEALRVDTANHLLGLRLNIWTSLVVFVGAVAWFVTHRGPREDVVEPLAAGADSGGEGEPLVDIGARLGGEDRAVEAGDDRPHGQEDGTAGAGEGPAGSDRAVERDEGTAGSDRAVERDEGTAGSDRPVERGEGTAGSDRPLERDDGAAGDGGQAVPADSATRRAVPGETDVPSTGDPRPS